MQTSDSNKSPTQAVAPSSRSWTGPLLVALTVLPGLLLAVLVYRYGVNVPYWDEWDDSVVLHMKYMDGTLTLADFFSYTNEHRPALPRAIDLIVEILTHGNRRVEMFVQIATAGLIMYLVYRLARRTVGPQALALTALASWLVFSTVQYENWLWGEQLILVLPVALLWLGLTIIYSDRSYWFKVIAGILCGIAAICCFAGGFGILLLLGAVQLLHARAKRSDVLFAMLAWIFVFTFALRLYTLSSPPGVPPATPQVLWLAPDMSCYYLAIFFGAPFWSHVPPVNTMILIGGFLILLSLVPFIRARRTFDRMLPWTAVLGFSFMMALLTLAGRLQFGVQQAMTSRYATFAVMLPIAALFLWGVTFNRWSRGVRWTMLVICALYFAGNLYGSFLAVTDMRNTYLKRRAALAELPYINVHTAQQSKILGEIYPDRDRLREQANAYSAHGILPPMVKP